jgi:hypothetical protein
MNHELKIRQSFAKLRRILGSNYAGKGRIKSVRLGGEGGGYIGGEGAAPLGGCAGPKEEVLLLIMVVTPSSFPSWW